MSASNVQKRGGSHRTHGLFQGGGPLNAAYHIIPKNRYKYSTQLRNTKSLEKIEAKLHSNLKDLSITKFRGNLEVTDKAVANELKELDKEEFLLEVQLKWSRSPQS